MHDLIELERRGVPGVAVLAGIPFAEAAARQARLLGGAVRSVLVDYPILNRTDDEMRGLADAAVAAIVAALTSH